MANQIFGQTPEFIGHNYMAVESDGSTNTNLLNEGGNVSDQNPLPVREYSFVSSENTSTTALSAGQIFTGEWVDVLQYSVILTTVFSDVSSAVDGFHLDWSSDGVTRVGQDAFSIPANTDKTFSFQPVRRYVRVHFINGSEAQTMFNLETHLKSDYIKPSSHRIQDSIITEDDAELVKSVITGESDDGTFRNIRSTIDGTLKISDNSNGLSIAQGNVTGTSFIHKFGQAPDFDAADNTVTIWDGANDADIAEMTYTYSTSAIIDSVSSTSVADTQDIEIQGLDGDYSLVTQTVTLSGQTRVPLNTNLLRVFRMRNVGSVDVVGFVYCYENTALSTGRPVDTTKIRGVINDGNNQTLMAVYTVPAGKTAYMRSWFAATAGGNKSSNYIINLRARPFGQVFQLKHRSAIADNGNSHVQHEYTEPEVFAEKTDIQMSASAVGVGVTAASIAGGFDIVLVDNT